MKEEEMMIIDQIWRETMKEMLEIEEQNIYDEEVESP